MTSYNIIYYTILYYAILYYTVLYYTILYYTILYYTIPAVRQSYFVNVGGVCLAGRRISVFFTSWATLNWWAILKWNGDT